MKQCNNRHALAMLLITFCCLASPALAAGTARASAAGDTQSDVKGGVAVSIRPLAMIVRELVGDRLEIHQLIDAGQDPHHGALQPSRRLLLAQADLVVWVGPGLESFLARPLANFADERQVTWLPGSTEHSHRHGVGEDPHPWLAPDKTLAFSRQLAEALIARYPALARTIQARLSVVEERLKEQMSILTQRMAPLGDRSFVAEHAAYGSFVAFAGLSEAGSLSDSSGVVHGARNLHALRESAGVACVAVEQAPGSRLAIQLAEELRVPVVEIDPFGTLLPEAADYADLMDSVAAGFEQCLAGE